MYQWKAKHPARRATLFGVMGSLVSIACGDKAATGGAADATSTKTTTAEPSQAAKTEAKPGAMVEPKAPIAARVFRELASIDRTAVNDAQRAALDKCLQALSSSAGEKIDGALERVASDIKGKTFDPKEAHEYLAAAAGGSLPVTPEDIGMCVRLRGKGLATARTAGGKAELGKDKADPGAAGAAADDCQSCYCDVGPIECCGSEVCACSCEDESGVCEPYCESSCFPGTAMVLTASGTEVAMRDLKIGDRVAVMRDDGTIGFDEVYLFTHKDEAVVAECVELRLASGRRLLATARHFVPVSGPAAPWSEARLVAVEDVAVGHWVWARGADGEPALSAVVAVERRRTRGLFNPLTWSGTIIVDGVVASAHSDWFLDGVVSVHTQGAVYQAVFAPVRGLYRVLGPGLVKKIAEDLGIVDAVRTRMDRWHRRLAALFDRRPAPRSLPGRA